MFETNKMAPSILIVDDEPRNIQILGSILQEAAYSVEFATSGEETLEWVATKDFDLILLDIMMPRMDGFEVCIRLKNSEATKEIPIIFLTAKTETESIVKGFETGAVDYVTKPFNKQELLVRVKNHLALRQAKQNLQLSYQKLEQQYTELQASRGKLEDLSKTQMGILEKVNALNQYHFTTLKKQLTALVNSTIFDSKDTFNQAMQELQVIDKEMDFFQSLYQSERAIHSKRVLLAESSKKQQIIAKMALGGTGVELDPVSSLEEGKQKLRENHYDIICTDTVMIELTQIAKESFPEMQTVFMTSEDAPSYLSILNQYPYLNNIVSRNEEERSFTLKSITTTIRKLITHDYFGLEKYLNWGVEVRQFPITKSSQRSELIHQMEYDFASKQGVRKSILNKCSMVAEELLMNAIYDAPVDEAGNVLYNHLSRTTEVVLKPHEQGVFRYACDGMLVALSVEDPFGAFDRETILNYLQSCYEGTPEELQAKKGGAGRGLYAIMETSDLVVFNVRPKLRTEIIALFNIDPNKSKNGKTTSFHYFSSSQMA